jgi:hypothetical protein
MVGGIAAGGIGGGGGGVGVEGENKLPISSPTPFYRVDFGSN